MNKTFLFTDLTPLKNTSGGSGAETWVVKDKSGAVFVRKFASGDAGRKLLAQTQWLKEFRSLVFCPVVLNDGFVQDFYFYDMNYLSPSETAFEKLLAESAGATVTGINLALTEFNRIFENLRTEKNAARRESYISEKFFKNIQTAKTKDQIFSNLADAASVQINGENYDGLSRLLENSKVKSVLKSVTTEDLYSTGHGDLTLSNLLVQDEKVAFIDPNPNFEFISLEQEYSKVLQSTVVKYEFFNQITCEVSDDNSIKYQYENSRDFSFDNREILASKAFRNLKIEKLFLHLAVHLARILPYIKPDNKMKSYVYFAEIIRLLNSIATDRYILS